jgi:hypothetical protein
MELVITLQCVPQTSWVSRSSSLEQFLFPCLHTYCEPWFEWGKGKIIITRKRTNNFWLPSHCRDTLSDLCEYFQTWGTLPFPIFVTPGKPWKVFWEKIFYRIKKPSERPGKHLVWLLESGQGDNKKFESIRIKLRDLTWSQVCSRDPGLCWPGSLGPVLEPVLVSHLRSTHTQQTFPRSLCLTSHSVVQHSDDSVRIMGSDGVEENVSS